MWSTDANTNISPYISHNRDSWSTQKPSLQSRRDLINLAGSGSNLSSEVGSYTWLPIDQHLDQKVGDSRLNIVIHPLSWHSAWIHSFPFKCQCLSRGGNLSATSCHGLSATWSVDTFALPDSAMLSLMPLTGCKTPSATFSYLLTSCIKGVSHRSLRVLGGLKPDGFCHPVTVAIVFSPPVSINNKVSKSMTLHM